MVKKKHISNSDFKKISSKRKQQLLKFEPSNEKMFQTIKKFIEKNLKNKNKFDKSKVKTELSTTKESINSIKTELDSNVSATNDTSNVDSLNPTLVNTSDNLMTNNQLFMDFMKMKMQMKSQSIGDFDSIGIPINDTLTQSSTNLLLNTDTPTTDDYANISDLLTPFPGAQSGIPGLPQPPNLNIPDPSIRTEISDIYLNNKFGKMDNVNIYNTFYDDGISHDESAFGNLFNNFQSSPAITQQSSFKNNSFPGLQNQKLDLFGASNDSLNNSLSFSNSSIADDNVSISLMNQLTSLNGLNSSGLSSYSDLTGTPNLTALNSFSNSSPELLGLNKEYQLNHYRKKGLKSSTHSVKLIDSLKR